MQPCRAVGGILVIENRIAAYVRIGGSFYNLLQVVNVNIVSSYRVNCAREPLLLTTISPKFEDILRHFSRTSSHFQADSRPRLSGTSTVKTLFFNSYFFTRGRDFSIVSKQDFERTDNQIRSSTTPRLSIKRMLQENCFRKKLA